MGAGESPEDLMRRFFQAFDARDLEAFVAECDEEIETYPLLTQLTGQPYRGHQGVRDWWAETFDSYEYEPVEVERVIDAGDAHVAFVRVRGRGKASGVEIEMRLGMHFRLRNGRLAYNRVYLDRNEALRDAGLS
jgi:ketosteroid isomerase-like protein